MWMRLVLGLSCWFLGGAQQANGADKPPPKAKPLEGAESHLDVPYLPEYRYTGNAGPRGDRQMWLNLYLPPQGENCPLVLLVHGGGYGEGDKDSAGRSIPYESFVKRINARGYAAGSLNYILNPKTLYPQVFYDGEDALRLLRKEAERYRLDPTRFGAVGFSAGGWLISSMSLPGSDLVRAGMSNGVLVADLAAGKVGKPWQSRKAEGLLFSFQALEPSWPEHYGLLQAISFDFALFRDRPHAAAPAVNRWVGDGFKPEEMAAYAALGVEYDLSVLTGEKYKGKGVHVPGLDSPCKSATGDGEVPLEERILQFFDKQFGPEGRAPAPEIRPSLRVFKDEVTVSMLVPSEACAIHFTTDGSEPTPASQKYTAPFSVKERTVVKALTVLEGRKPSGVVTATFVPGPVPPRVTGPEGFTLPEAEAGKPYEVRFACDAEGEVLWQLAGEIAPYVPHKKKDLFNPLGLDLDPKTGVLSGTPKHGGRFWVQVRVGAGPGQLASLRNYVLSVRGGGAAAVESVGEDTNEEVARLEGWSAERVDKLIAELKAAGLTPVQQDDGGAIMILVPSDEKDRAAPIIQKAQK